jgi:hypothetical protein
MNEMKRESADQSRADRYSADAAAAARCRRRPDNSWMIEVTPEVTSSRYLPVIPADRGDQSHD